MNTVVDALVTLLKERKVPYVTSTMWLSPQKSDFYFIPKVELKKHPYAEGHYSVYYLWGFTEIETVITID